MLPTMRVSAPGPLAVARIGYARATIGNVITIGIDFALQPKNAAICSLRWSVNEATVKAMQLNVTDEILLALASAGDKVGIDIP
jgi:hypothetical protein